MSTICPLMGKITITVFKTTKTFYKPLELNAVVCFWCGYFIHCVFSEKALRILPNKIIISLLTGMRWRSISLLLFHCALKPVDVLPVTLALRLAGFEELEKF